MRGRVKNYILEKIREHGAIHMTLIDPEKTTPEVAARIAREVAEAGTSAIMVGGSIGVSEAMTDEVVLAIKRSTEVPVILFPGSPTALSRHADAVWFLSVLNSQNPYFITGAQMQGAPIVKRYGLEVLPLGYIIVGEGGAVSIVSYTRPLPFAKPEVVAAYALAAEYMGFQFVYLEGGSGGEPVPPKIVKMVKGVTTLPLIVGGGIRSPEVAKELAKAGADIIVTGTIVEESENIRETIGRIVRATREGALERSRE
ncbi:phosphoglycerol geranylgeranyltransferase [Thermofilum pendens]|uniref:Geranylgeranylglyceryl phosphate synthase n=1 Tax=Thermofilum pendens (strain DSM 2475 / Hrk 5) TaxID=368408 RepID=GGGPS_THEPD|nr:geranylgeranylglyceryl/heptaprenylglyceryl phosphate synthase [Thermofilum pendens]A1RXV6.1 RecName: Full=Geranylgeranylglyceryl phosphate synthase; Short=GGGP synthase; Short=GGGPS; AltName: Full=(S)-3-O-geranylgeranylglyceryl phosphate synthase; AltName: Full=Phosphoglycerol geranylgeranyltransferase [Thermofilum pendens Hrk 5]ABL78036.1 geranylgeranylglyceryl diphosphate synthase [Thermofilum pendens Hrk 5]